MYMYLDCRLDLLSKYTVYIVYTKNGSMTETHDADDIIKARCSSCKKKYSLTDDEFEIIFGYKELDVPCKHATNVVVKRKLK